MRASVRRLLLAVYLIGVAGNIGDLLLIGHVEEWSQRAPVVVLGATLLAAVWWGITAGINARQVFRLTVVLLMLAGGIGLWFHLRGNIEFEREVSPQLSGIALLSKAVRGASPPSLAPGSLIHLGLLGLICTVKERET